MMVFAFCLGETHSVTYPFIRLSIHISQGKLSYKSPDFLREDFLIESSLDKSFNITYFTNKDK